MSALEGERSSVQADEQRNLHDIIQRVLKNLLFTEAEVFYFHMQNLGVGRNEILNKPEQFAKVIHNIFGKSSPLVEKAIILEIAKDMDLEPKEDFVEMIKSLDGGKEEK